MEWQACIKCGGASVGIHFTGGSQTAYGVNPAKYTTEDPAIQAIIENSGYFKEGRIVLLSDVEGSGAYSIVDAVEPEEAQAEEEKAVAPEEDAATVADVKTIEVACLDDAKQYLVDNFGIAVRNLRSKKAIEDAATQNGIVFVGI